MMAREIATLLQNEYSKSGIVDFNFHCAVYDQGMTLGFSDRLNLFS